MDTIKIISAPRFIRTLLSAALLGLTLGACTTRVSVDQWPAELPDRALFVGTWKQQHAVGDNSSSLQNHLIWVRRFYDGSVLYPIGWNDMTTSLLESLDSDDQRAAMQPRLFELGKTICIEWAKNNSVRKIDSAAMSVWGNALRTSAQRDEQHAFISKVEEDVQALLAGQLKSDQIVRERYYPPEDYDNF